MRMIERGNRPGFPLEPLVEFLFGKLDRDRAIEPGILRFPDLETIYLPGCAGDGSSSMIWMLRK